MRSTPSTRRLRRDASARGAHFSRVLGYLRRMSYAALQAHYRTLFQLRHAEAMLGWDEATMMPAGAGPARAEALATLRGLIHERATAPELEDLFAAAEAEGGLDPWQAANLREMKRAWLRETSIPRDLVEAASGAESQSEQAWRVLRSANDWRSFRPLLETVVSLKRETAQALSARLGLSPYDALLDGYEPGARRAAIAPLFEELRAALPPLIERILEKQSRETVLVPPGPFPVERQRWLGAELMSRVGFDWTRGRLDVSHHPFCGGVPTDVRITTRYDEEDFQTALMGVMHETGHAKYEQNLPAAFLEQPVGSARGMSVHESQSLLQEMQICRSREFIELLAPLLEQAFPRAVAREPRAFTPDNLYRLATRVKKDFIRVDADEATYPCHVLLRFEVEEALIDGKLRVADIPDVWDEKMQELLGLSTRGNDRDGCMQDVHWAAGLFGYFPTYTLGALTAAQLFQALTQALPGARDDIRRGEFGGINGWLREHVWSLGSLLETPELVRRATGKDLGTEAFLTHLERRYLE